MRRQLRTSGFGRVSAMGFFGDVVFKPFPERGIVLRRQLRTSGFGKVSAMGLFGDVVF